MLGAADSTFRRPLAWKYTASARANSKQADDCRLAERILMIRSASFGSLLRVVGNEKGVFVQHVGLGKASLRQDVELESHGSRGIFDVNVVEDLFPIGRAAEGCEVVAVAGLHERLDGGVVIGDQVGDEEAPAGAKPAME